jgi:ATP-dependent Lon protease
VADAKDDLESGGNVPVLPTRDSVLFPHATEPFTVGRPDSVKMIESLSGHPKRVIVVAQRNPRQDAVAIGDLYSVGTLANIITATKVPGAGGDEEFRFVVVAEGLRRVKLVEAAPDQSFIVARAEPLADVPAPEGDPQFDALCDAIRMTFSEVVELSPDLPDELGGLVAQLKDPALLSDFVAAALPGLSTATRQEFLEELDVRKRLQRLAEESVRARENLMTLHKIRHEIQEKVAGSQREFFLREQLQAIQRELGEGDEQGREQKELARRIDEAGMPEEAKKEATRELGRLAQIPSAAAEYVVVRTYLDWMLSIAWAKTSATEVDVQRCQQILDEDHYDLEKVKDRIVEYLAVRRLKPDMRGPILCFVGPPGVGKTSLGMSIARALGRRFVRISLGGMSDEAEIRGHRRTYVGALPGQILQGLRRAGTLDPVFMLDEVDKLRRDFHGDPASALLEVLDPEQNFSFRDHYLDVPVDLSHVLFITTANVPDPIPPALLDRMEMLELPGYSDEEKLGIARKYLVTRQVAQNGLSDTHIRFTDKALRQIARAYTHEAGVRNLERSIGTICRKQARKVVAGGAEFLNVTPEIVRSRLGPPLWQPEEDLVERVRKPGVAVALAWTPNGGEILFVEATRMPRDKGEFAITGQVGEVMQESAQAALSWLRANCERYGIEAGDFKRYDVHVHVPAGAVPKDGPSAGIVMVAALTSAFTERPLRPRLAMTGEITLSGQLLPVGGIKEKVLAALQAGIQEVVLPAQNRPHVEEDVPEHLRKGMTFHFVHNVAEALDEALSPPPVRRVSFEAGTATEALRH